MKKKFPSISEVCEWRAFGCDGEQFNLRHLDAQIVEYDNPYPGPDKYRFYVTYGFHCFTTSRPDEDSLGEYHSPKESRPFCRKRYELSKYLPDLVARLAGEDTRCYFNKSPLKGAFAESSAYGIQNGFTGHGLDPFGYRDVTPKRVYCILMTILLPTLRSSNTVSQFDNQRRGNALLHRHRLGQIPGFVHIRALVQGHVVRQQLQGHGVNHRL